MKAAIYRQFGDPAKVITTEQAEIPTPGKDQVLIKMSMSPIHNHDLIMVRGEYGVKPPLPAIGGTEGNGTIAALGEGVTGLALGQRVAVAGIEQAWAEDFIAPAAAVVPVPAGMDDATASQILGMPLASVLALNQFDAKKGDWLIVNAANGAVGKVIAAVGAARGIQVALLVRRDSAARDLAQLGFNNIFVTEHPDWKKQLKAAIGNARVAGAVEMVGGKAAGELASLISDFGLLLSFGAISNEPAVINVSDLIFKQITVRGFWSLKVFQTLRPEELQAMITELFTLAIQGKVPLPVDKIFPLDEAPAAMAEAAKSRDGKVLIAA